MDDLSNIEASELIHICKERKEIPFLFNITKHIAETDSIGECPVYCSSYTNELFNDAKIFHDDRYNYDYYDIYLIKGSLPVYKLYLQHLKVIS